VSLALDSDVTIYYSLGQLLRELLATAALEGSSQWRREGEFQPYTSHFLWRSSQHACS